MNNKFKDINLNDYKPLRDVVFETLRNAILSGNLQPNERLMEIQLSEKLGVSRTPVREAIRKLELEGLVTMIPRKGAYVSDLNLDEMMETLVIREALEIIAIKMAMENFTDYDIEELEESQENFLKAFNKKNVENLIKYDAEIHRKIHELSKNRKLISIMENINEELSRFRLIFFSEFIESESVIRQHEKIIKAIKNNYPQKAADAMKEHLESIENNMKNFIKENKIK